MAGHHDKKRRQSYTLNPYEIAVCGYSNSGKTTLATELVEAFAVDHRVGYVKNAHDFDLDKPGKDSWRAAEAGATDIFVSAQSKTATISRRPADKFSQQRHLIDADCVIVEGFKQSPLAKVVMIDEQSRILTDDVDLQNVIAYAGIAESAGDLAAPYFQRDAITDIKAAVDSYFATVTSARPLNGLVLAGGKSTRMQRDKAALDYHGKPQVMHAFDLLASHCSKAFVSSRPEQDEDDTIGQLPRIHDRFLGMGPMGGILSAMHEHPDAAWLILACDLPFVDNPLLAHLLKHRNPMRPASAYNSTNDGFPEPLCAIYEPKCIFQLLHFLGLGYSCPRKVLINTEIENLEQPGSGALDNINDPDEFAAARERLHSNRP
jgi:molybdopterin-guanine dinucleotide biosynthesis protein A